MSVVASTVQPANPEDGEVLVQFADDFVAVIIGEEQEIQAKANRFLGKLSDDLDKLKLKISPSKCAAINFGKTADDKIKIKIKDQTVDIVRIHKYLGYILDKSLKHRKHIEYAKERAEKNLNIVKLISSKKSPSNPETVLKIGDALIKSRLEYGATIYGNAALKNKKKIETTLNAYVRTGMRYLKTTPTNVLVAE